MFYYLHTATHTHCWIGIFELHFSMPFQAEKRPIFGCVGGEGAQRTRITTEDFVANCGAIHS